MKCVKLNLQDRSKMKPTKVSAERPRRLCQQRMVNSGYKEDTRWMNFFDGIDCKDFESCDHNEKSDSGALHSQEDLVLSVQNLQFEGNIEERKRVRSSFQYKTLPNSQKHRMFVKQLVDDINNQNVAAESEFSDYNEDYAKFFSNNDQSRPSSSKSSIILFCLKNKCKENKSIQVDLRSQNLRKTKVDKAKKIQKGILKSGYGFKDPPTLESVNSQDTKITFHKNGKRKSLTISRNESPSTVQVIRVDVVCNYSCSSSVSDNDNNEKHTGYDETEQENKGNFIKVQKSPRFGKKFMLTKTMKTLDEKISGGKVTLMCKTFKLNDRLKVDSKQKNPALTSS